MSDDWTALRARILDLRKAPLVPALATVLLPVLLAGLLIGAGDLRKPAREASTETTGGIASVARAPLPAHRLLIPWPVPSDAYFSAGSVSTRPAPTLQDRAAILVDLTGRQVLYENNALTPLPTASLAKLVTILVALRHASLQTVLTVPYAATQVGPDETTMGLGAGEQLTVEELIEGILLVSANDAALVLAQAVLPEAAFIADMNALVRSWQLPGATFANPTGLDEPGEVASAYDLAVVAAQVVSEQPELLGISDQKEIQIPQTSSHKAYDLRSLIGPVVRGFPGADGLKTGFTDDAGYCLAATDQRGGRTLLAIVLNSPTDVDDAQALLTYGFSVAH